MDKSTALSYLMLREKAKGVFESIAQDNDQIDLAYVDEKISTAEKALKEIYARPVVHGKDIYLWRRETEAWNTIRHAIILFSQD